MIYLNLFVAMTCTASCVICVIGDRPVLAGLNGLFAIFNATVVAGALL